MNPTIQAQFDKILGPAPTQSINPVAQTRSQEILNIGKQAQQSSQTLNEPQPNQAIIPSILRDFQKRGENIINGIQDTNKVVEGAGNTPLAKTLGVGATAGHIAGQIAGGAGDIIGEVVSQFLPDSVKSKIGDAAKFVSDRVNQIPGMTPEIAKSLGDVFNAVTLLGGEKFTPSVIEKTGQIASDIGETAGNTAQGIKDTVSGAASKIKESVYPSLTESEKIGKIIQGKIKDIAPAQRTFEALPSDIGPIEKMSPKELSDTISKKIIKSNLDSVDAQFSQDTSGGHSIKSLGQVIGDGKSAIKVNYVQNAIDELKTYYTKTGDIQGLSDMKSLENKAKINGLTSQDINNLARTHGGTINAFNANGEAASGLSKQAAENTRSGLKSTARNLLAKSNPEAAAEATRLDKEVADAIRTKNLLDKQVETANKAIQKNGKESSFTKLKSNIKNHPIISTGAALGADKVIKKLTGIGF